MTPQTQDAMLLLIRHYQRAAALAVGELRATFGQDDLLRAWKSRSVPQIGRTNGGSEYRFHGIGCAFACSSFTVDIDFGPGGRFDGFDAWRLYLFAQQWPAQYPNLQTQESVKRALTELESLGLLHHPHWSPGSHLMLLVTP